MALKHIWQPLKIRSLEIPNRVARAANSTSMFPTPPDDQFIAYHYARARSGVGLTILEAGSVHPNSQIAYLVDQTAVPGFEKLMATIRPTGMKVFQQLWHGGHNLGGKAGQIPWGPSATPSPLTGIISAPMGQAEIDEIVAAFARAALLCRDAGLDGVEIHAGHGYLIQQFLSPLSNLREDGYNGDLMARARFLIEILKSVRAAVGPDFPIAVRMGASPAIGGLSADDVGTVAAYLEAEGLIDLLDITYSDYFLMAAMAHTMAHPGGYQLAINEPIARAVSRVPRLVTGRYRTLEEAEQVLRDGQADIVSLVRAQIADPDLVAKTRAGRAEDVRPCIACNQGCVGGLLQIGRMQCAVNPAAGYELMLDETKIERTATPRKVLIVGGGPAGLEAARIAALEGHKVVLAEAMPTLGGTLNAAKRAPHLHILGDLTDWLERQVYALGVEVRLSTYVDADDIAAEEADEVIVATGAMAIDNGRQLLIPGELPPGVDLPHVYEPVRLFSEPLPDIAGRSAVVFDDVGRYDAIASAEQLQRAGAAVTFVTSLSSFAPRMLGTSRDVESFRRLSRQPDFRLIVNHNLMAVAPGEVTIRAQGADQGYPLPADIVVLALNRVPVRDLYDAVRDSVPAHLVGDALSPRDLLAAMHDGHRAARAL